MSTALAKSSLEDFKAWLEGQGIAYRPGKGAYQVLQVKLDTGWACVFNKDDSPNFYTLQEQLKPVVVQFFIAGRPVPLLGQKIAEIVTFMNEHEVDFTLKRLIVELVRLIGGI